MSAQNLSGDTIDVVPTGTPIPLPSNQFLGSFTVDPSNEIFTATVSGTYMLSYVVHLETNVSLSTWVNRNGQLIPGSVVFSNTGINTYTATLFVSIAAGDTISLMLADYTGPVALQNSVGTTLTLVRLA